MGKNTPQRQTFIIDNLRIELDKIDSDSLSAEDGEESDVDEIEEVAA